MSEPPPAFWVTMCVKFLCCPPSLTSELWRAYGLTFPERAHCLRFALEKVMDGPERATVSQTRERLRHTADLLPARDLLAVSLRLSPEGRRGRRRDIVGFEERLLGHVAANGDWL